MTCQRGQELLIDLLYGELAEPLRSELQAHLAGCATCAEEYARLRRGRAAVQRLGAEEPPLRLPQLVGGAAARRTHPWRRWLWVAGAAAAVLAVALLLEHATQVAAQNLPIEIKRTGVSLTILSRPPEWDSYGDAAGDRQSIVTQQKALVQMPTGQTALQAGMLDPYRGWPGLALVRDQRLMRHVPAGAAEVRFAEVPAGIWPDSVRLRTLDGAESLTIREQNYQYDLASADAVLSKHIDHPISVRFKGGQEVRGTLLSHDGATLVVRPEGEGPRSIARREVAAVGFEKLPQGLLTTPTLVWQMNSQARAAERQFEVDYLTTGLSWRADYVIKLRPAQKAEGKGDIIDRADLIGYATVVNNSGVTYQDAQLKLMAGDVNLLIHPSQAVEYDLYFLFDKAQEDKLGVQMTEKSFFEYHLYTLTRPTTLANHETKQLEMVSGQNLGLRRGYVFDPTAHASAALVVSEMENSEANGLGKPLPKGIVRLYAPAPEGVSTYVAQTQIDHTPVMEKLRLPWGHAFDLVGQWREMATQHRGAEHQITSECSLRNHKDYEVTITVIIHVPATTYAAQCDRPWHVREVGLVEVTAVVPAGAEVKFTFQHSFNDLKGGGLRSPQPTSQGVKP